MGVSTEYETDEDWGEDDGCTVEPVGSCDDCCVNVYPDDARVVDGLVLCDQCAFYRQAGGRYG